MKHAAPGPDEFFLKCMFWAMALSLLLAMQSCAVLKPAPRQVDDEPQIIAKNCCVERHLSGFDTVKVSYGVVVVQDSLTIIRKDRLCPQE